MNKEPEKSGTNRNKKGQFVVGQSGNPNGKPKGSGLNLTSLLKEHLEKIPEQGKIPYKDLFIKTLLKKALVENDIQALKLIINYVDGLPQAKIDLTTNGNELSFLLKEIQEEKKPSDITKEK